MLKNECAVPRGGLTVPLLAQPEELSRLRRLTRSYLELWELETLADTAQLCVSELVANVILHIGEGTPITLRFSARGRRLRIELNDPEPHRIPVLLPASDEAESGRGMALLDAVAADWGVALHAEGKAIWCELDTTPGAPQLRPEDPCPVRTDVLLNFYVRTEPAPGRLAGAVSEDAAVRLIADVLHWLRAHGHDPDTALDHAQTRFEAMAAETSRWN
ncbi:ATP-binding protein [Streptomyces pini]|uniref:Anti-sigma regulatory factor (Ser/Thr protein kinase) n=1 Tax=Streptomyces pini TaxID=1520580 RepID=A0A1I4KSH3_9ACTN|nr:ATP-binding protein [Streptomyces pini]SFL81744.1 Anti-sigma regulatory factor (Ser/Thr protein kinase) [Streptomyces pini]